MTSLAACTPEQISSEQIGPQMKSSSPVMTSVGHVIAGRLGRRSNVWKISLLKSFKLSALIGSDFSVSRYPASAVPKWAK